MSDFTIERVYIPAVEQQNCLNAIADYTTTQKDVAGLYADCIRAASGKHLDDGGGVDFKVINLAITKRWPKGLLRVKTMAWKLLKPATEGGR